MTKRRKTKKKRFDARIVLHNVGSILASPWLKTSAGVLVLGLALFTLAAAVLGGDGRLTTRWATSITRLLGWGLYPVAISVGAGGVLLAAHGAGRSVVFPWVRALGVVLLLAMLLGVTERFRAGVAPETAIGRGGGKVGGAVSGVLTQWLGPVGGIALMLALAALGLSLALELPLSLMAAWLGGVLAKVWRAMRTVGSATVTAASSALGEIVRVARKAAPVPSPARGQTDAVSVPVDQFEPEGVQGVSTPSVAAAPGPDDEDLQAGGNPDLPWELPRVEDMLDVESVVSVSVVDLRSQAKVIEDTCRSLGVPVTVVEVSPGPVVTQFGLEPGYLEKRDRNGEVQRTKVKVSRIVALANDLALALAAAPVRIEAPVPGRSIVGLEVPNAQPAVVGLRGIMESKPFQHLPGTLRLGLGRDVAGKPVVDDLRTLPHLLVAGATGSGKSVCLSAIIASLLCQNTPRQLRMIMIDPKRVELSAFGGIPHLAAPVIVDMERAVGVLQWVLNEMDRRYQLLAKVGVRNTQAFNEIVRDSPAEQLPSMVVLIDELADLMLVSADAVEDSICRLAQLARATGIHLVVATQRPSVDVVTGLIKANLPARIAFAVASQTDSRVILDSPGADALLGCGDGLYMAPDNVRLIRMQGAWVSDGELRRIIAWWQEQAEALDWSPADVPDSARWDASDRMVQPRLWVDPEQDLDTEDEETDELLEEAIELVREEQRASISMLQRHFRIGYTRAARIVDTMDERGVIGPPTGSSKPRDVLLSPPDEDDGSNVLSKGA